MHLERMDQLAAAVAHLDTEVDRVMAPFADPLARLQTIPGVGKRVAEVIVAECGVDMTRFPTAQHLASWAGLCPGHHESAGKQKSGRARKGNGALRVALCEAAWAGVRTKDTYISVQFRRFRRRFGTRSEGKAIFAVAHTLIVIAWHILAYDDITYVDLGPDWFDRRNDTEAHVRRLVHQLERLGLKVDVRPAA